LSSTAIINPRSDLVAYVSGLLLINATFLQTG